jgi:hypothetical protein
MSPPNPRVGASWLSRSGPYSMATVSDEVAGDRTCLKKMPLGPPHDLRPTRSGPANADRLATRQPPAAALKLSSNLAKSSVGQKKKEIGGLDSRGTLLVRAVRPEVACAGPEERGHVDSLGVAPNRPKWRGRHVHPTSHPKPPGFAATGLCAPPPAAAPRIRHPAGSPCPPPIASGIGSPFPHNRPSVQRLIYRTFECCAELHGERIG